MLIDQWGPRISHEQYRGPAGYRPPRAPTSDPTPISLVKGTYSGEIESLARSRNCDSQPGKCDFSGINIPGYGLNSSLLAILLSVNNFRSVAHTHASATKQYKLVLVKWQ